MFPSKTHVVDERLSQYLRYARAQSVSHSVQLRPSKDDEESIERATQMWSAVAANTEEYSFELTADTNAVSAYFAYPPDSEGVVRGAVTETYPQAQLDVSEENEVIYPEEGSSVYARELWLAHDYWHPLHVPEEDPQRELVRAMTDTQAKVCVQVAVTPWEDWRSRLSLRGRWRRPPFSTPERWVGDAVNAYQRRADSAKERGDEATHETWREAVKQLQDARTTNTDRDERYAASIRVIAWDNSETEAADAGETVVGELRSLFKHSEPPRQGLTTMSKQRRSQTLAVMTDTVQRRVRRNPLPRTWWDRIAAVRRAEQRAPTLLSIPTLAALAHLPDPELGNSAVQRAKTKPRGQFPVDAPRPNNSSDAGDSA